MKNTIDKLITVIIPVYNTEQYFDRCIKSVISQTYKNIEIIVINDASKGNIAQLIKEYQKNDSRIKFIENEKNLGLFKSRLVGIKAATGDYIAFVDSDDYISFDYYRSLIFRAEETKAEIVVGRTVLDRNNQLYVYPLHDAAFNFDIMEGSVIQDTFFGQEYRNYSWHTIWSKLYKTELIKNCIKYYEKLDKHIIMTEDIAYSSVLFANAYRIAVYKGFEAYYYYQNMDSAVHTIGVSLEKYEKCVNDVTSVFSFVESFIKEVGLTCYLENVEQARRKYARLYLPRNQNFRSEELNSAIDIHQKFDCSDAEFVRDDILFETELCPFCDYTKNLKKNISSSKNQFVYFDFVDSLMTASHSLEQEKEMYDLAIYMGKKVIIVSKLKYEMKFLEKLLELNGYENYEKIIYIDEFIKQKKKEKSYYCNFVDYRDMKAKDMDLYLLQVRCRNKSLMEKFFIYLFIKPSFLIKKIKEILMHCHLMH